jgi:predicted PurR-regulated permease PerM
VTTPAAETPGDPVSGHLPPNGDAPATPAASAGAGVASDDGSVPAPTGGRLPPGLLPRGLVILLGAAALVVVTAGIQAVAWLIAPVAMALVIVIFISPVQSWLLRKGWPGWAATLVLILLVFGLLIGLALMVVVSIAQLATELPKYASQAGDLVNDVTATLTKFGVGPDQIKQFASSLDIGKITGLVESILGSVAGLATSLVFLLALLLFLSVETSGVGDRLASVAEDRPQVSAALRNFATGTRTYLLVTTVFGLIVAVLDTIALAIMGVPLAITWGLLAFVTNYIPNVGFIIGVIPPALLALLTGGVPLMVAVIIVYCLLNLVIQSLIQPRFIGDAVGLSVTVTFVALVFWAWLLGPLGAILAIPLTLLAKALLVDIDPRARWAAAFLRSTGKEPDPNAPPKVRKSRFRRRHREQPAAV